MEPRIESRLAIWGWCSRARQVMNAALLMYVDFGIGLVARCVCFIKHGATARHHNGMQHVKGNKRKYIVD